MQSNNKFYCFYCGKEGHYTNTCSKYKNDKKEGIYNPIKPYVKQTNYNKNFRSYNNNRSNNYRNYNNNRQTNRKTDSNSNNDKSKNEYKNTYTKSQGALKSTTHREKSANVNQHPKANHWE